MTEQNFSVENRPSETQSCGCVRFPAFFDGHTHFEAWTDECHECTHDRFDAEQKRFEDGFGSFDDSKCSVEEGEFTLTEEDFRNSSF